jgi:hypothetical protein
VTVGRHDLVASERTSIEAPTGHAADPHDRRHAVVSGGLALTTGPGRRITLHELTPGSSRGIGSFSSAAHAWRAIDLDDRLELAA